MALKKPDVLFVKQMCERLGCGFKVQKSARLCLFNPLVIVAVAVEDNAFVRLDCIFDKVVERLFKIVPALKIICKFFERFCNRSVQNRVCARD